MWIGAILLFVVAGYVCWVFVQTHKEKGELDERRAFGALVRRGKKLRAAIASARNSLARRATRIDAGFLPAENESVEEDVGAEKEGDEARESEVSPLDPHLLAVVRLLTRRMRGYEGVVAPNIQRLWDAYDEAIKCYERAPQPSLRHLAASTLASLDELQTELRGLGTLIDRHAWEEILSRYQMQAGVHRDRLTTQIERSLERLAAPALEFPDLEGQRPGMRQYLEAFDRETDTEGKWAAASEAGVRLGGQLSQYVDDLEKRARQRLTLKPTVGLIERGIEASKERLQALSAEGYRLQAGSAEAAIRPLKEELAVWKVRYDAGIPLAGDREGLNVLRDRLLVFEQRHVQAWAFYRARVERRSTFFDRVHKLGAAYEVVKRGWQATGSMDALRQAMADRITHTLQEAKAFHDAVLQPFSLVKEPPAEGGIIAVQQPHDVLAGDLDELIGYVSSAAERQRGKTGSFPVVAKPVKA